MAHNSAAALQEGGMAMSLAPGGQDTIASSNSPSGAEDKDTDVVSNGALCASGPHIPFTIHPQSTTGHIAEEGRTSPKTLQVICADLEAIFHVASVTFVPLSGQEMGMHLSGSAFEAAAGLANYKRWRRSVKVAEGSHLGKPLLTWLLAHDLKQIANPAMYGRYQQASAIDVRRLSDLGCNSTTLAQPPAATHHPPAALPTTSQLLSTAGAASGSTFSGMTPQQLGAVLQGADERQRMLVVEYVAQLVENMLHQAGCPMHEVESLVGFFKTRMSDEQRARFLTHGYEAALACRAVGAHIMMGDCLRMNLELYML